MMPKPLNISLAAAALAIWFFTSANNTAQAMQVNATRGGSVNSQNVSRGDSQVGHPKSSIENVEAQGTETSAEGNGAQQNNCNSAPTAPECQNNSH